MDQGARWNVALVFACSVAYGIAYFPAAAGTMASISLQSLRSAHCLPPAHVALASGTLRTISFDKSPGDVQVLYVSSKEFPGAVGTVEKDYH